MGHYSQKCPSPKNIKKSMQATWNDSDSKYNAFTTFEDARYDPNDMLAFVASMKHENDSDCDNNSDDDEFTNEQRAEFFNYLVI